MGMHTISDRAGAQAAFGILRASSADHRFCGPRPFGRATGPSNSLAHVGRYPDTVHDQTATFLLLLGAHTGVLVVARPSPFFRAAGQPGLDRVQVDVLHLLVVFLDGAQRAVEEPGLQQMVARTTASVVRGFFNRRTADRKPGGPRYSLASLIGHSAPCRSTTRRCSTFI